VGEADPRQVLETLEPLTTRRVLRANLEEFAHRPIVSQRRRWPAVLGIAAALAFLGGALVMLRTSAPTPIVPRSAPPAAQAPEATSDESASAGNTIVEPDCFSVDARDCLTADRRLLSAITLLRGTTRGGPLLRAAAESGVSIRVGTVPPRTLGMFRPSTRAVTIGSFVARSSARAQAAVLAHELRHVADWKQGARLLDSTLNCYAREASAFQTEAAVWDEIKGSLAPSDAVESEVDDITQEIDAGHLDFWLWLGKDYHDECAGR
jgi:hypothetical protein